MTTLSTLAAPVTLSAPSQSPSRALSQAPARPLRFITCGNVDDGKSTLIGRLLWDTKMVMSDHVAGLYKNGSQANSNDNDGLNLPDFSLLLDGLQAEREQGITIDVAYRYFSTANRSYIVADTPGHEQYTGNMATGASTADLAIILVDARAGLQEQTRRHTMIVSLMGIRQVVLVVNKMDLVDYDRHAFQAIADAFTDFAKDLPLERVTIIPTSAPQGENVTVPGSARMPWYTGPTLLDALEGADVQDDSPTGFRFSVQRVSRPDESFRGYQGTVSGGRVAVGDAITVAPRGIEATISRIVTFDGDQPSAAPGDAVTLVLDRNIDIARGDMIAAKASAPTGVREVNADLVVLTAQSLDPEKRYWLKSGSRRQRARIAPQSSLNLQDLTWAPAQALHHNAIGRVTLHLEEDGVFDPYADNRATGSFVVIDPDTLNSVAGGMVMGAGENLPETVKEKSEETITLSLPLDLARKLMRHDLLADRLDDVEIIETTRRRLDTQAL
ncbi:MAG: sulfate adenylyltransferase subunit 1 [Hyphomicrobiales bacterium]